MNDKKIVPLLLVIAVCVAILTASAVALMFDHAKQRYDESRQASRVAAAVNQTKQEEAEQQRKDAWNHEVYLRVVQMEKDGATQKEIWAYQDDHVDKPPKDFRPKSAH